MRILLRRPNPGSLASTARRFRSSWLTLAAVAAGAVAVAGASVYLSRTEISDFLNAGRDHTLSAVGMGVIPLALWLAVLSFALARKRSWLRHPRLWLSSLGLVAVAIGSMSFFHPYSGILGWFSLYEEGTLGGQAGDAIIGSATWVGTLRLFGVFLLTVAIATPALAIDIALIVKQGALYVYVLPFMAVAAITSKRPRGPRNAAGEFDFDDAAAGIPAEIMTPYLKTRGEYPARKNGEEPHSGRLDLPELSDFLPGTPLGTHRDNLETQNPTPVTPNGAGEQAVDGPTRVADSDAPAALDAAEQDRTTARKVNRFWAADNDESSDTAQASPPARSMLAGYVPPINGGANGEGAHLWRTPPMDLLHDAPEEAITEEEIRSTAETIQRTLKEYDVDVEIGHVRPGPTVTMYGLIPGWVRKHKQSRQLDDHGMPVLDESGKQVVERVETKTRVKVDTILAREKDLALALKTHSIRIETPVMGRSLVGIEVPNPEPSLVTLRGVMEGEEFQRLKDDARLPIALGKGSGGETVVLDLAKMPHLLIAGATGSGKSVCINSILSCLIMEKSPAEMRLLLVDPKRVELTPYNGIPHLMAPVVVETDQVVGYLRGLTREMLSRYRRMEEVGVRNIDGYNERMPDKMPLLVVAIDELADLMMSAAFDVEQALCRLAQLGRATGIHLIVATQRPSVDVVTGLIKANFPSRISFGVTSQVDSRTILDSVGADKLLGRGDMLYLPLDSSKPSRVQSVFISDGEIESLVGYWRSTPWPALEKIDLLAFDADDEYADEVEPTDPDSDQMLGKAIDLAHAHRKLSTSLLQRRLRVGYPRAARLMDQLEDAGVVGPGDGSKSRDVIMNQT